MRLPEVIEAVCDYLKENPEGSKAVLANNRIESEFANALFKIPSAYRFTLDRLSPHYDEVERELLLTCFSMGRYSLIRQWLGENI